jgi:uncharacterized membrane protein YkvA (DUF1232 family)
MWFFPFLAGAGFTWFMLEVFQDRAESAEQRLERKIDELKADLLPTITEQGRGMVREEIDRVKAEFLPFVSDLIQGLKPRIPGFGEDPRAQPISWRKTLANLPGVAESVAMYFAFMDPETPWSARMEIAAALTYVLIPEDWLPDSEIDDMAVIMYAFSKVQDMVKPHHIDQARRWLEGQGVTDTDVEVAVPQLEAFGAEAAIEQAFLQGLQEARDLDEEAFGAFWHSTEKKAQLKRRRARRAAERGNERRALRMEAEARAHDAGYHLPKKFLRHHGWPGTPAGYGAIHPGGEWEEYIVSGHRAPSHALPQFRRMGGRFYGAV